MASPDKTPLEQLCELREAISDHGAFPKVIPVLDAVEAEVIRLQHELQQAKVSAGNWELTCEDEHSHVVRLREEIQHLKMENLKGADEDAKRIKELEVILKQDHALIESQKKTIARLEKQAKHNLEESK